MPEAGDIKKERDKRGVLMPYKWVICSGCGKGRWKVLYSTRRVTFTGVCKDCSIKAVKEGTWISG